MSEANETSLVSQVIEVWESNKIPSLDVLYLLTRDASLRQQADAVLVDQRFRWQQGTSVPAEEYLRTFCELAADAEICLDIIYGEFRARGESPALLPEFICRFPELEKDLVQQLAVSSWIDSDMKSSTTGLSQETVDCVSQPGIAETEVKSIDAFDPAPLQFSDFELQEQLGKGAMGAVHRAIQKSLNKPVAIKLLTKRDHSSTEFIDRFLREARAAASLKHSNIVDVHGVGRCPDGGYFLVMDLVEGRSLQKELADGPLEFSRAAQITANVAAAIQHVHDRSIIHRDLKPGNVICTPDGNTVIVDFGLARLLNNGDQQITVEGAMIGTPSYMAPEQVDPERGPVSSATDIYGLGGLLFSMLTGKAPVAADSIVKTVAEILSSRPVVRPTEYRNNIPAELVEICVDCLKKIPAERPASAADVERRLLTWQQQGADETAIVPQSVNSASPRSRKNKLVHSALAASLLILIVAGFLIYENRLAKSTSPLSSDGNSGLDQTTAGIASIPVIDKPLVPLSSNDVSVVWDLQVFPKSNSLQNTSQLGFVTNDHRIRLTITLNEPRYVYVYWVGSDGSVQWIDKEGSPGLPVASLSIPATEGHGFPVAGPAGSEFCLLLVRNQPLPDPEKLTDLLRPEVAIPELELNGFLADGIPVPTGKNSSRSTFAKLNGPRRVLEEAESLYAGTAGPALAKWKKQWPQEFGYLHYLAIPHRDSE